MDYQTLFILLSFLLTLFCIVTNSGHRNSRLPPGPYPLPIIGNLLKLGDKPHQSLATLSKRYGPLMSLKLGSRTTIVLSSPDIAKEFFQTHDMSISSRTVPDTGRVVDHDKYSLLWLPVGDLWRKLRRISKECLFSLQRLDATQHVREKKVQEFVDHVNECCISGKGVHIGGGAFTTVINVLSNLMFSMDIAQYATVSSQEFRDAVTALMELMGKPNLADFFPILKPLDPQGLFRQSNVHTNKLMAILDTIVEQRLQTRSSSSSLTNNDVLDSLLNLHLKDESEFSRNDIRHLFFILFVAGTDTTSTTLEWALAELIRNPQMLEAARLEVTELMQDNRRNLREHDIPQLPYLQAVVKETLRLHPPVPFLIPHKAIHDFEVQGFMVPKDAQVLCNVWEMGRDPNVWSNPETFMPERFLDVKIDYKGHHFEFIPFGAGRRICPGLNIAERMIHLMLGSLLHKYDWKLEKNLRAQDLNMEETFGITLLRSVPLVAFPVRI